MVRATCLKALWSCPEIDLGQDHGGSHAKNDQAQVETDEAGSEIEISPLHAVSVAQVEDDDRREEADPCADGDVVNDALSDFADAHFRTSHVVERTGAKGLLQGEDGRSVNPRRVFGIGREGERGARPLERPPMTEASR